MSKTLTLKAVMALVAMITDSRLRGLIKAAIKMLMASTDHDAESWLTKSVGAENTQLRLQVEELAHRLANEKREHQDHHEEQTMLLHERAGLVKDLDQQLTLVAELKQQLRTAEQDACAYVGLGSYITYQLKQGRSPGALVEVIAELCAISACGSKNESQMSVDDAVDLSKLALAHNRSVTLYCYKDVTMIKTTFWERAI